MKQSDMNNAITMAQSVFAVYQRSAKTVETISRNRAHSAGRENDPVSGWSRPPAIIDGGRGSPSSGGKVRGISVVADVKL